MSVLRPGDLRNFNTQEEPERRGGSSSEARTPQLTQEWIAAFDTMPFAEMQQRYRTDAQFHALADQLHENRYGKKGEQQ